MSTQTEDDLLDLEQFLTSVEHAEIFNDLSLFESETKNERRNEEVKSERRNEEVKSERRNEEIKIKNVYRLRDYL